MKIPVVLLGLGLLLVPFASGQSSSLVPGVKIISSGFDSQTHTAKLVFMNDTATNITAYHYCLTTKSKDQVSYGGCTGIDTLRTSMDWAAERKKRPWLPVEPPCGRLCRVVHPGETETLMQDFSSTPAVTDAQYSIDLVVHSDATAEGSDRAALDEFVKGRKRELAEAQLAVEVGSSVLASEEDNDIVRKMIRGFQTRNSVIKNQSTPSTIEIDTTKL